MKKRSFAVIALCLSVAFGAAAEKPGSSADAGQQVAVDENGQLRQPTVAEQQLLASTTPRFTKPLVLKTYSNGMMSITLDERYDHTYVGHVNEAGELVFTCTDNHEAVATLMAQPADRAVDTILRLKPTRAMAGVAERE
jgi:hypothetical protein